MTPDKIGRSLLLPAVVEATVAAEDLAAMRRPAQGDDSPVR